MEQSTRVIEQYYAIVNDERPSSLLECQSSTDRRIDREKYAQYKKKEEELEAIEKNYFFALLAEGEAVESANESITASTSSTKKRKKKSCKALRPYYFDNDGTLKYLQPTETVWYFAYVRGTNPPPEGSKLASKFRRRFRMPYPSFVDFLSQVEAADDFQRWRGRDAVGDKASPLGLLLLGALRYLGRGLTFDDLEEYTAIGEETHRQFFHVFIKYGAETLYPQHIQMPSTAPEYNKNRDEFTVGGLWGAGFSSDATNVLMWRCQHNLKQSHIGFKNTHPARTYNVCVNHRREVLHTTKGHPARWNDKTLAFFDDFLTGIHDGNILQDVSFQLLSWGDGVGSDVCSVDYKGAWGLVDNGYHRWACTQAPSKVNNLLIEQRLSDWIESFRKDSECFFGILKGRWRILKTGVRLEGPEAADRVWLTCVALHNWLLKIDGLHKQWEEGVPSDWEGELGQNDPDECRLHAPFAIQRLNNPQLQQFGSREHEQASALIRPSPNADSLESNDDISSIQRAGDGAIYVNSLSYSDFRQRLVTHFDILHRQRRLKWPTRKAPVQASNIVNNSL
jgi:hypothetical protein